MKLLKMPKIKKPYSGVGCYIREIIRKYPKATHEDIFATIIRAGLDCSYGNVSSTRSAYFKEKRIREQVGVK